MNVLLTIVVVCCFVVFLCWLIVFAGKFFEQSGVVELSINNSKKYSLKRGERLLSALAECGIYLPAACGGKGNCGRCKVRILSGAGPVTSLEKVVLNGDELADNQRLACQVKLRENMELIVDENLLTAKSFKARLIETKNVAYKIKTLRFKLEDNEKLSFKAGQYVQVSLELPWERVTRAYSISSSPSLEDEFTLDVQLVDGGIMSSKLHRSKIGEVLDFTGPYGDMAADGDIANNVILVAGGVGLAPMRSLVSFFIEKGCKNKIFLFYGVKSRKNLYCEDYYRTLEKQNGNFRYIPVLSEPLLEDGWTGRTGLVTEILEKELANNNDLADCTGENGRMSVEAYLCGPSAMLDAASFVLKEKGVSDEKIHCDPFSF